MQSKSILIIDDDLHVRHSMMLILQRTGYQVNAVSRAAEALVYLKTGKYDLIILDFRMPENGLDALSKIQRLYPSMAMLILTAQTLPKKVHELNGFEDTVLLMKPVTPECLLEHVETLLVEHA
jgi:two-component system response regulator HydG